MHFLIRCGGPLALKYFLLSFNGTPHPGLDYLATVASLAGNVVYFSEYFSSCAKTVSMAWICRRNFRLLHPHETADQGILACAMQNATNYM